MHLDINCGNCYKCNAAGKISESCVHTERIGIDT